MTKKTIWWRILFLMKTSVCFLWILGLKWWDAQLETPSRLGAICGNKTRVVPIWKSFGQRITEQWGLKELPMSGDSVGSKDRFEGAVTSRQRSAQVLCDWSSWPKRSHLLLYLDEPESAGNFYHQIINKSSEYPSVSNRSWMPKWRQP